MGCPDAILLCEMGCHRNRSFSLQCKLADQDGTRQARHELVLMPRAISFLPPPLDGRRDARTAYMGG